MKKTVIIKNAADFLNQWREENFHNENLCTEELNSYLEYCIVDASAFGFTRDELEDAAGGDLRGHLRDAI